MDYGVAPDYGVAGLVFESCLDVGVEGGVDFGLEGLPVFYELGGLGCAFVMAVVEVLDYGFAVVEFVGVGDVVEEEEQVVGGCGGVFVELGEFWGVLAGVA